MSDARIFEALCGPSVKRRGTGMIYLLCPFHMERTPSFRLKPNGYYKCFGCDAKGHYRGDMPTHLVASEAQLELPLKCGGC